MRHEISWTWPAKNWIFDNLQELKKDLTDKGKLFERMGRKTAGLLTRWLDYQSHVASRNCPFFRMKEWAFFVNDLAGYHNSEKRGGEKE